MMMRKWIAAALVLLLVMSHAAIAEQVYIDLNERFGDQQTYEFGGETYYLKKRVSTSLVLCANLFEEGRPGVGSAELILLLPIDDQTRFITPIQLEGNMLAAWLEDENCEKTIAQLFSEAESVEEACVSLVNALNALFPEAMIEHYALFDLRGLPVLDGIENDETNVTGELLIERLRAVKKQFLDDGNANINSLLSDLSSYVITDMKSGAMMKIADKADRYDRSPRTPFPVLETEPKTESETETDSDEPLIPNMELFEEMMVSIYYDDTGIWEASDNTEREN